MPKLPDSNKHPTNNNHRGRANKMTDIFEKILEKHKEGLAEVSQLGWSAGIKFERERVIKVIEDNVGNMTAEILIELIRKGQK
jgi:hypothetical protein